MTPPEPVRRGIPVIGLLAALAALLIFQGCGAPSWIRRAPTERDAIYAVGTGDPGWWNPPMEAATEEARKEIAHTIKARVISVLVMHSVGSEQYTEEVADTFSDEVVRNAEVVDKWLDESGRLGVENRLYVLMRFRKNAVVEELKKTATQAAERKKERPSPEQIERAAQMAFDEMDKAIEEKNKTIARD